jgi:hypothetical protein
MSKILIGIFIVLFSILMYTLIGTNGNVEEIKKRVPLEIKERNWEILRYEGYQFGSWNLHGGTCWYHVVDIDNPNIQYRVRISMWDNELQWYYNGPEILQRLDIKLE